MTVSAASLVFNVSLLSGGLGRNGLSLIAGGTLYWGCFGLCRGARLSDSGVSHVDYGPTAYACMPHARPDLHQLVLVQVEPHCVEMHSNADAADLFSLPVGRMPPDHDTSAVSWNCSPSAPAALCQACSSHGTCTLALSRAHLRLIHTYLVCTSAVPSGLGYPSNLYTALHCSEQDCSQANPLEALNSLR